MALISAHPRCPETDFAGGRTVRALRRGHRDQDLVERRAQDMCGRLILGTERQQNDIVLPGEPRIEFEHARAWPQPPRTGHTENVLRTTASLRDPRPGLCPAVFEGRQDNPVEGLRLASGDPSPIVRNASMKWQPAGWRIIRHHVSPRRFTRPAALISLKRQTVSLSLNKS